MSKRVLLVHYVLPEMFENEETRTLAVCGEHARLSLLEGVNRHVRHVYVTLSLSSVNCPECMRVTGVLMLAEADLGWH